MADAILRHRSLSELADDVEAWIASQTDGLSVSKVVATEFAQIVAATQALNTFPSVLIIPTGADYEGKSSWKWRADRVNIIVVGQWQADISGSDTNVWDLIDTIARRFLPGNDTDADPSDTHPAQTVELHGVQYAPLSLKPLAVGKDRTALVLLLAAYNQMADQGDAELPTGSPLPSPASRFPNQYGATIDGPWSSTYTDGDAYMRFSVDSGTTYGDGFRFKGDTGAAGADAIVSVSSLPASPVATSIYRLTTTDTTAKAAPGLYRHDGTGWTCLDYSAPYALGNLGVTPSLALIPGLRYTATHDQAITSCTISMSRPGMAEITAAGQYAWATPTMASRTSKLLGSNAWTAAGGALKVVTFEDDGTYLWLSATEGVAP